MTEVKREAKGTSLYRFPDKVKLSDINAAAAVRDYIVRPTLGTSHSCVVRVRRIATASFGWTFF